VAVEFVGSGERDANHAGKVHAGKRCGLRDHLAAVVGTDSD
jgi:hypothetical protein